MTFDLFKGEMPNVEKNACILPRQSHVFSALPLTAIAEAWDEVVSEIYKEPATYEVVFTSGEEVISRLYVEEGCTIGDLPEGPDAAGQAFIGWFADGTELKPETVIRTDVKVVAVFDSIMNSAKMLQKPE
ncbi:MAG: hypothetical protein K6A68_09220 [Clostridiales bacterium]|nr:hypothetical protein [Clostridiales bacterium]